MAAHPVEIRKSVSEKRPRRVSSRMKSDFLFAPPSFLSGMGSVLDLFGNLDGYNFSRTEEEADWKAIYSDYRMVGQDIEAAMRAYERNYAELIGVQDRLFDPDDML